MPNHGFQQSARTMRQLKPAVGGNENMIKKYAIALNIIGIIVTIGPIFLFWIGVLFWGNDSGSIALIGGENGPTTIFITSKISKAGMIFSIAASIVFSFNIFALCKGPRQL